MAGAGTPPGHQTFPGGFPQPMRRQLWPLCCGAAILSGFKDVAMMSEEDLDKRIESVMGELPDFQVYSGENMKPALTFLTLNSQQVASAKIMKAVTKAGFVPIGTAAPRGSTQSFFVRDTSKSWKAVA